MTDAMSGGAHGESQALSPVILPGELRELYAWARACFIDFEELSGDNHQGALLLFRDALELLVLASKESAGPAEKEWVDQAIDKLGQVATRDYEECAWANLEAIDRLSGRSWRRKWYRNLDGIRDLDTTTRSIGKLLRRGAIDYTTLKSGSHVTVKDWMARSQAAKEAYRISAECLRDLRSVPFRVTPVVGFMSAVASEVILSLFGRRQL